MMERWIVASGLTAVVYLAWGSHQIQHRTIETAEGFAKRTPGGTTLERTVRLLAVGDINLGRSVGQSILKGDTLYPFVAVVDTFKHYDIVFANLECTLSNQNGETQHPRNELIFTGPPEGAIALRNAGIHVVSTANNHALDYGVKAHGETMENLTNAGVRFVGTAGESTALFEPLIVLHNTLRIAFFACTDIMNITHPLWKRYVAEADTAKLLPRIRAHRDEVDYIIVSYHGGEEYADRPTRRTKEFARAVVSSGADLFLGHHPHVSYGVEEINGRLIVYSLGNFVFRQFTPLWTQRSFAFAVEIVKTSDGTRARRFSCLPVLCGVQPRFVSSGDDARTMLERIKRLSSQIVSEQLSW